MRASHSRLGFHAFTASIASSKSFHGPIFGKPKVDGERSVIADNNLDRNFQADRPNQKWLADFT